jgi:hypothetical protein
MIGRREAPFAAPEAAASAAHSSSAPNSTTRPTGDILHHPQHGAEGEGWVRGDPEFTIAAPPTA